MAVKITQLTGMNVQALRESLTPEELEHVTITASTAVFDMDANRAHSLVANAQTRAGAEFGTRGHPYQSLHAVLRKVFTAAQQVPNDFPVKVLGPDDPAEKRMTCGTCQRSWDDAVPTSWTPTPQARCPFEYYH